MPRGHSIDLITLLVEGWAVVETARGAAATEAVRAEVVRAEATGVVARVGGRAGAGVDGRAATRAAQRAVETAGTAGQS